MNTPKPDELTVMTEMLAVLSDSASLGGTDTGAGMEALFAGCRRLHTIGRTPHYLLVMAMSGWLGALEGVAAGQQITMTEVIRRYASAIAEADAPEGSV